MALRDRIDPNQMRPGTRCTVAVFLDTLTDAGRDEFVELAGSPVATSVLARAVKAEYGFDLNPGALGRHRRGDCKCL